MNLGVNMMQLFSINVDIAAT